MGNVVNQIPESTHHSDHQIVIQNVYKSFTKGERQVNVLDDISLHMAIGKPHIFAIRA
jgi:ABC-type lipoprotein export system ATPase subunit